jgi:hypothetical protein
MGAHFAHVLEGTSRTLQALHQAGLSQTLWEVLVHRARSHRASNQQVSDWEPAKVAHQLPGLGMAMAMVTELALARKTLHPLASLTQHPLCTRILCGIRVLAIEVSAKRLTCE